MPTNGWGNIYCNSWSGDTALASGSAPSFSGLFDQYGYPAFGASMRLLGINYTDGLVRVRAFDGSTDQGTADVMPYDDGSGEQFIDLNSTITNLDATAIGRGLTTSDTLGDLLSSGVSNYDGFITTWFDQSGNANDFLQATATKQPKIATAGVLELENAKPALSFNGTYVMVSSYAANETTKSVHFSSIGKLLGTCVMIQGGRSWVVQNPNVNCNIGGSSTGTATGAGVQHIFQFNWNNSSGLLEVYKNNALDASTTTSPDRTNTQMFLGDTSSSGGSSFGLIGTAQEFVIYETTDYSNRSGIATNENNAFTIYP